MQKGLSRRHPGDQPGQANAPQSQPQSQQAAGHAQHAFGVKLATPPFFESHSMSALMKFLHIAAAIVWLGGVSFMLFALRSAVAEQLAPPQRLPLIAQVLRRFFVLVWISIVILLASGLTMMLGVGMKNAPMGWHIMFGTGLLMFALFGHLYFGPFRRLKLAVTAAHWAEGGKRVGQIAMLAQIILVLGVLAIAAVIFLV
jgi:uncharacterized membrane protein